MFKKLKSLFVVEEEKSPQERLDEMVEGKQAESKQPEAIPEVDEVIPEIFDTDVKGPAKPQKKFTDILIKAMDRENLEGSDYLEFKESLRSLEKVIEDEETRYKSSFAVLQNGGITKAKILESGNHYMNVLKEEKSKFEGTFKEQQSKQIKSREDKIQKISNGITERKKKLQQLIDEIEKMEKDLEKAKVDINKVAGKVQLTKDQFMASYRMIIEQIQQDTDKINQYLN